MVYIIGVASKNMCILYQKCMDLALLMLSQISWYSFHQLFYNTDILCRDEQLELSVSTLMASILDFPVVILVPL